MLVHDPKDACASTTPIGGIPEFGKRLFTMGPKGMRCQSERMREGIGATSLVHPDLVRDTPYLILDGSQTDAVPSEELVKTKRLTC